MSMRSHWLDLFTGSTWQEFLDAGGGVSGFRDRRWRTVQHIKAGDYLLCYLTGISRWIGLLEVTSTPFRDATPIWKDEDFPCRMGSKVLMTLKPETAVPVLDLKDRLSIFRDLSSPRAWTSHFRGSPTRWNAPNAKVVIEALQEAQQNPIERPVNPTRLARR